ncbi:hypothetical protein H9P43_009713 [Blastocladiella emersonii ATCC 22665]|nr:hypothetical protein H9P43_009713 [Blastocladiella emersonii ATCC 22665]
MSAPTSLYSVVSGASTIFSPATAGLNPQARAENQRSPLDELASLRRTLMADEDTRPSVSGVLSIKVKEVHFLELGSAQLVGKSNCYCSISVRNTIKKTHVACKKNGVLSWDQIKHFPVIVPRSRKHPFNLVKLQILQVSDVDPTHTTLVGSVSFHIHDIISVSPIASVFDVWDEHRLLGDIRLEMTFNYGSFGYGYSPQLKEERRTANEMVAYSLFPRINPPASQMESEDGVMAVKAVPHPPYIPFREKVLLSYGKELGDLSGLSDRQYAPDLVARKLDHLVALRDQYAGMNDRVARIMFLQHYLTSATKRPEVMLDTHETPPPPPSINSSYVQPFNVASALKDDIVFRALAKRREALSSARNTAAGAAPTQPITSSSGMLRAPGLTTSAGPISAKPQQQDPKRRGVYFQDAGAGAARKRKIQDFSLVNAAADRGFGEASVPDFDDDDENDD